MAKKGNVKEKEKQAVKKETKAKKQEAKASKSAKKQARKVGALDSDEEDIDTIMASLAAADAKRVAVTVEIVPQPSARVNASLSALPSGELIMFGGEFFDGSTNTCYNELYRFDPHAKGANMNSSSNSNSSSTTTTTNAIAASSQQQQQQGLWRMIISPNTPPHRCSHQAVIHNNTALYLFGGEFATANQFHHYSDTWKLDLASNRWTKIECKRAPPPRSGHRMVSWRNYIVCYGGFYQTFTHDKWYGDVWLFDTRAGGGVGAWTEVVFPITSSIPAARSGTQIVLLPNKDTVLMYGGYSEVRAGAATTDTAVPPTGAGGAAGGGGKKGANTSGAAANFLFKKTRSVVHTDMWLLKLSPLLTGGIPTWERVRTTGIPPTPRVGFTMSTWKDKIVLFGGVQDKEGLEEEAIAAAMAAARGGKLSRVAIAAARDTIRSTFYNDVYSFDLGRRRWYTLELRKKKADGSESRRRKAKNGKGGGGGGGNDEDVSDDEEEDNDADDDDDEAILAKADVAKKRNGGKAGDSKGSSHNNNKGSGGGGRFDMEDVEDTAFYYYQDGKLVKIEEEDFSDGEDKEGAEQQDAVDSTKSQEKERVHEEEEEAATEKAKKLGIEKSESTKSSTTLIKEEENNTIDESSGTKMKKKKKGNFPADELLVTSSSLDSGAGASSTTPSELATTAADDGNMKDSAAKGSKKKKKKGNFEEEMGLEIAIATAAPEKTTVSTVAESLAAMKIASDAAAATAAAELLAKTTSEEATQRLPAPLGRIRAGMWTDGHWLYIYGGLREETEQKKASTAAGGGTGIGIVEREVTLDDMWRLELRDRHGWECLLQGRMEQQQWNDDDQDEDDDEEEEEEEEEEEDDDSDSENNSSDDDSNEGSDNDNDDDDVDREKSKSATKGSGSHAAEEGDEDQEEVSTTTSTGAAAGVSSSGGNRFARSQVRMTKEALRARQLRDKLGIEDAASTPLPGEELSTFFARTVGTWTEKYIASGAVREGMRVSGKAIRRASFAIARARYEDVWPLLAELHEVEEAQKVQEEEAAQEAERKRLKARGGKGSNKRG